MISHAPQSGTAEPSKTRAGRITTHVLDTAAGQPARGMAIALSRHEPQGWVLVGKYLTNADGRCDTPLLEGAALQAGQYELLFQVGAWRGGQPGFYECVPIRFTVSDPQAHHHVPLILAPFGYSTYRGS